VSDLSFPEAVDGEVTEAVRRPQPGERLQHAVPPGRIRGDPGTNGPKAGPVVNSQWNPEVRVQRPGRPGRAHRSSRSGQELAGGLVGAGFPRNLRGSCPLRKMSPRPPVLIRLQLSRIGDHRHLPGAVRGGGGGGAGGGGGGGAERRSSGRLR